MRSWHSIKSPFGTWHTAGGNFSPAVLFAQAEPGAWYDPSDLTTLFQDTAGTTPVTTAGQSVALALDKSKGLVLGSELRGTGTVGLIGTATAATYNTGTGAGSVTRVDLSNQSFVSIPSLVNGNTYRIEITVLTGTILLRAASATGTALATLTAGSATQLVVPTTSLVIATSSGTATFTLTSVKELPGTHATQSTAASRPLYGVVPATGRRNLLTSNTDTLPSTSVVSGTTAVVSSAWSDGVSTSVRSFIGNTAASTHYLATAFTVTPTIGVRYTYSVEVKPAGYNYLVLHNFGDRWGSANFTLIGSGSVATRSAGLSGTNPVFGIQNIGNGVYRISASFTWQSTAAPDVYLSPTSSNTFSISEAQDGVSGALFARAQFELGSTATAYQRVVSAQDVTEAGVPSLSYLFFDGVDDFLITPTITPNIDKAQVFAGVRKLSDASPGILVESSAAVSTNNGSFYVAAPENVTILYSTLSHGTAGIAPALRADNFTGAAPDTAVISAILDISGDLARIRRNGVNGTDATADQGTGNFLAYPLYIGRRGGTTLPFNGNIFSLVVRFGANLDAGTIIDSETWVNIRTRAY